MFTNKEETDRDVKVRNRLGCSNHEVVELQVLREARKTNSTVQYTAQDSVHTVLTQDFTRAECSLFRTLLGRISRNATVEGKG